MKVNDAALKHAQMEFRYHWPAFNRWWAEKRMELGITDMGDMPLEPFEACIEAYLKAAK